MIDLLTGSIGNRRAPSAEALDKAHRLANTTSILLGVYLAALLGSVAWYALNPFYVGTAPDIVVGVAFVVAAIAFASWKVAAYRMVPELSGAPADRTPGWAAGGYFVPVMNLWVPVQIMGEIRDSGDARALDSARLFDTGRRFPLGLWWALWLGSGVVERIFRQIPEPALGESGTGYQVVSVIAIGIVLAMTGAAIVVVRQQDEGQQEAAEVLARLEAEAARAPAAEV